MPHKSGKRYSDYIVEWDDWDASDKAVPIRVSRVVAIRMLDECWELFKHAGNVPSISERLDYQSVMGLRSTFPPHPAAAACPEKIAVVRVGARCITHAHMDD